MIIWKIKIALRNLFTNKLSTSINIVGISIGLATSLLLLTYVKNEFNTDTQFQNHKKIYRVQRGDKGIWLPYAAVDVIKKDVPGIEQTTCFHKSFSTNNIVSYNQNNFALENVILADSDFFKVFDYKVLFGDKSSCLTQPNSLILTKKESNRIFGNINPVGKTVKYTTTGYNGGEFTFTITAIIDDPPENSSINFKSIISQAFSNNSQISYQSSRNWRSSNFITYILLCPNADADKVTEVIRSRIKTALPENSNEHYEVYKLNPLKGIYFDSVYYWAVTQKTGKKPVIIMLGIIGILILVIAGINYFNLVLAQSKKQQKSRATTKIVGASQLNVLGQSILETALVLLFATILSLLFIWLFLPYFNELVGKNFELDTLISLGNSLKIYLILCLSMLLFGALPTLISGKYNIIELLKGKIAGSNSGIDFKYGLIVFQFAITIVLIISVLIIHKQNRFLLNSNYGMDMEQVYCIRLNPSILNQAKIISNEIQKDPRTKNVAFGYDYLGDFAQGGTGSLITEAETRDIEFSEYFVYGDFVDLFKLKVIKGRTFNKNLNEDKSILVNKTFMEKNGISNSELADVKIHYANDYYNIVGVLDDFNFKSKHFQIEPIIFRYSYKNSNILYVKLNTNSLSETKSVIKSIREIWHSNVKVFPFTGEFLDEHYEALYKSEIQFMKIIFAFSILSIFLCCLGLFGITMFLNQLRTKEIGIRKVNGATGIEILKLLNQSILIKIAISFIIGCPIAWYLCKLWLQNFAYKTNMNWWIFAFAGMIAISIALITVSWQTLRAARRNPVEALRYE